MLLSLHLQEVMLLYHMVRYELAYNNSRFGLLLWGVGLFLVFEILSLLIFKYYDFVAEFVFPTGS